MKSTNKIVKAKINEHILSYFDRDAGWDSDDRLANLKDQLKSFDYMPTVYQMGMYMVTGGTFLVYYYDQRKFLDSLEINNSGKEYTDDQVFKTYCNLVARQIEELVK